MKHISLLFILIITGLAAYSQEMGAYTLGTSSGNVDCYYSLSECNGKTVVLLRFNNRNNTPVMLSWNEVFTTKQVSEKTIGYKQKQIRLAPGISAPRDCEDADHKAYIVGEADVHLAYRADITGFEFRDVTAVPAN
jgi:hypothetical protein